MPPAVSTGAEWQASRPHARAGGCPAARPAAALKAGCGASRPTVAHVTLPSFDARRRYSGLAPATRGDGPQSAGAVGGGGAWGRWCESALAATRHASVQDQGRPRGQQKKAASPPAAAHANTTHVRGGRGMRRGCLPCSVYAPIARARRGGERESQRLSSGVRGTRVGGRGRAAGGTLTVRTSKTTAVRVLSGAALLAFFFVLGQRPTSQRLDRRRLRARPAFHTHYPALLPYPPAPRTTDTKHNAARYLERRPHGASLFDDCRSHPGVQLWGHAGPRGE